MISFSLAMSQPHMERKLILVNQNMEVRAGFEPAWDILYPRDLQSRAFDQTPPPHLIAAINGLQQITSSSTSRSRPLPLRGGRRSGLADLPALTSSKGFAA
jgi:hypothetical protein